MLGALLLILALLPLRGYWTVGLVLISLAFTIPGIILLRALRIPDEAVRQYPLYVPAASLLVMLFAGLLIDLIGPRVGIGAPLHGVTPAVAVIFVSLLLWAACGPGQRLGATSLRVALGRPSALVPLLIPAAAAAGALLLTNGHGDLVARGAGLLTVGGMSVAVLAAFRLERRTLLMLLFACALSAEWSFSLRSQEIVGYDISRELSVAQNTLTAGLWHTAHHGDAYSSMLSLTILPSVFASLTGVTPLIAFKVIFPILSALLPVSVFLMGDRFLNRRAVVLACCLILSQSYFFEQLTQLARQEIGLLFFAVLLFGLVDRHLEDRHRFRMLVAFAVGLVVSHYSSTYVAIAAVATAIGVSAITRGLRRNTDMGRALVLVLVTLVGGAALWYGAITHSSNNFSSFVTTLDAKGFDILPSQKGGIVASYLVVTRTASGAQFEQLAVNSYRDRRAYIHPLPQSRQPRYALQTAFVPTPPARLVSVARGIDLIRTLVNESLLVAAVLGSIFLTVRKRSTRIERRIGSLALGTVGFLVVIRLSATVAAQYNQTRALMQSLLILALPAGWLFQEIVGRLGRLSRPVILAIGLALVATFSDESSLSRVLTGGGTSINLAQAGEDYERLYMTPAELAGAKWASDSSRNMLLYADTYGQLRISVTNGANALQNVTPETLDQRAWLYGTRTNVLLGRARGGVDNYHAIYAWPNAFLTTYFDTMYTDGDSKVYHR